ncbi:MAG: ROK family protein [Terracidiphilus sp.]
MADIQEAPFLVYDIGGSHVSAALCLGGDLSLGPVVRALHPAEHSSEAFISFLHALGVEAAVGYRAAIGAMLAIPCPFDFEAGISLMRHKLPYLYGVNLRQALAGLFGWEPCRIGFLNDADAYLLGEIGAGAARGCARSIGITLGTGTGSAFSVDGHLVTEGVGVPPGGEIWNLPCEGGVVEDFLSSRAISGSYKRRTGMERDVIELAADAPHDPAAAESFHEFGEHLGWMIRRTLASFEPDVIVLGGGISRAAGLFLPVAQRHLVGSGFRLAVSELQDRAPLVGCAVARFKG